VTSVVAAGLKQVPLFSDLSQRQARQLAKHFKERTIPAGVQLTRQGEMSGVAFFVIADGTAAVIVDGERVGTIGPGDHFGELAMISETERTATVEALTPMRCYTIQFWHFRSFAKQNPDVTWKLLQHVAGLLFKEQSRVPTEAGPASPSR
jgi:CRP-like cAMP-binding protein